MSRKTRKASGWLVGAAVTAALAFGLSVAVAKPAGAMECADDGWNFLGSQPSAEACNTACSNAHYPDEAWGHWNQFTTCCQCLY